MPAYEGLPEEIYTRYGDEAFVDTLQPASDYGRLYPYIGKSLRCSGVRYGLADAQGRIVVDPVYEDVSYDAKGPEAGAEYLSLTYTFEKEDVDALKATPDLWFFDIPRRFQFAKTDGSWVSPLYFGTHAVLSEDRVIVTARSDDPAYMYSDEGTKYQLYDLEANLISEGEGYLSEFSEGLCLRMRSFEKNGEYHRDCSYIDKNGNVAIAGPFSDATGFRDGEALVTLDENKVFAAIDRQGNYLFEPKRVGGSIDLNDSDYITYWNGYSKGLIDRRGNIVVPEAYGYSWDDSQQNWPLLAVKNPDQTHSIINLQTGLAEQVEGGFSAVYSAGDGWFMAEKRDEEHDWQLLEACLIRGGERRQLPVPEQGDIYFRHVANDMFTINRYGDSAREEDSVSFFDASIGETVKSLPGWHYSNCELTAQGRVYFLSGTRIWSLMVLNEDLEPIFSAENMDGVGTIRDIRYLEDDMFSVCTDRFGGLVRMDGSWLMRVVVREQD